MPPALRPALIACAAPFVVGADAVPAGVRFAQVTIRERIIIRLPPRAAPAAARLAPPLPPPVWVERDAPRCIAVADLAGAALTHGGDVDLVLRGGKRVRAKLDDDCPALDFYSGFYLKPQTDGKVCRKRDVIRSRAGASCPIARFRTLVPRR